MGVFCILQGTKQIGSNRISVEEYVGFRVQGPI